MYASVVAFICETLKVMCKLGSSTLHMTRELARRRRPLPGPKGLPILGHILQLNMSKVHIELTNWSKSFGNMFQLSLLGKKIVVISDMTLLEKAFAGQLISPHVNDRSENITKHIFHDRKHIGLANLTKETVALRTIMRQNVLHSLMGLEQFEQSFRCILDKHLNNFVELSSTQNVCPDKLIKYFLADLNAIIVSICIYSVAYITYYICY